MNPRTDGQTDRRIDGQTDRQTDERYSYVYIYFDGPFKIILLSVMVCFEKDITNKRQSARITSLVITAQTPSAAVHSILLDDFEMFLLLMNIWFPPPKLRSNFHNS